MSVKVDKLIKDLGLEVLVEGKPEREIKVNDINRPGLQLSGFYNYSTEQIIFDVKRGDFMYNDELLNKIARRKQLINLLITFLSPTNSIMVKLSKNLDKLIFEYQKNIYKNYSNSRPILGYLEVSA